ncbi:hypothetical protein SRHO_G00052360 [Serrasalmus rhombeus]
MRPNDASLLSALHPSSPCLPLPPITSGSPCFATILEHTGMKWKREEERAGVGGIT